MMIRYRFVRPRPVFATTFNSPISTRLRTAFCTPRSLSFVFRQSSAIEGHASSPDAFVQSAMASMTRRAAPSDWELSQTQLMALTLNSRNRLTWW
jgi:hypothetical protein